MALLDFGVLMTNLNGLLHNNSRPTHWEQLYPITPRTLGDGYVMGVERVVSKTSGTFNWQGGQSDTSVSARVFSYESCYLRSEKVVAGPEVSLLLSPGELAIIEWVFSAPVGKLTEPHEQPIVDSLGYGFSGFAAAKTDDGTEDLASCSKEELIQRVLALTQQRCAHHDGTGRPVALLASAAYPLVLPVNLSSGQWQCTGIPRNPANKSERLEGWATGGSPATPTLGDFHVDDKDGNSFAFLDLRVCLLSLAL